MITMPEIEAMTAEEKSAYIKKTQKEVAKKIVTGVIVSVATHVLANLIIKKLDEKLESNEITETDEDEN